MENGIWLDRLIAAMKSAGRVANSGNAEGPSGEPWTQNDARCYELVEEMGREGYSCLIYTGAGRYGSQSSENVTYCQLRRNDGSALGTQVPGTGTSATRAAICRAYLALRLRTSLEEDRPLASILSGKL